MPAEGRSPSAPTPPATASASTIATVRTGRRAAAAASRSHLLPVIAPPRLAPRVSRRRRSVHRQGALRLPGQELPDERVLGVEHVLGRPGLDDPPLPQDVDVVGDPPRAHDVVGDDAEGRQMLLLVLLGL